MASCHDCVHVEVCKMHYRQKCELTYESEREVEIAMCKAQKAVDIECDYYKDQSRFVELPCKVGDTVYVIESIAGEEKIIQDHVETMGIGYYADGINIYQWDGVKTDGYFEDFGKTVFLTREEAEQALKEREENA